MLRRTFSGLPLAAAAGRKIAVIAHRGEHRRHAENTLPAIIAAIEAGAAYVEIDVRGLLAGGAPIPMLDEALAAMRGRCGCYLDWKAATAEAIAGALRKHGMLERSVIYGSFENLARLRAVEPRARVMPEAVSVERLRRSLVELRPGVVAFDRRDFRDDIIAVAREAGVEIFVDRLGADDNEAAWGDAIARGATGIQTDKAPELIAWLAGR